MRTVVIAATIYAAITAAYAVRLYVAKPFVSQREAVRKALMFGIPLAVIIVAYIFALMEGR